MAATCIPKLLLLQCVTIISCSILKHDIAAIVYIDIASFPGALQKNRRGVPGIWCSCMCDSPGLLTTVILVCVFLNCIITKSWESLYLDAALFA